MKRVIPLLLVLVMLLALLGGCGDSRKPVEMRLMNTDLSIEYDTTHRGTVTTEHGDVYEFQFDNNGLSIVYPDGKTYVSSAIPTLNRPYEGDEYLGMSTLAWALEQARPTSVSDIPVLGILAVVVAVSGGILTIVFARQVAELHLITRVRGKPDPSDDYVGAIRFGGALLVIVGIVVLVMIVADFI